MNDRVVPPAQHPAIDPNWYRQVLGQYPTGVCVVTAMRAGSEPVAMVVGSFTSVSLNPPLVAFFPDRSSSSWAKLRDCENFCVNMLSAEQEAVCRKLASRSPDKFVGTAHRLSSRGNPVLDGVVAWIECQRHSVSSAGDHDMVLGHVLELDIAAAGLPLLFFQGGYGRFAPSSLAALDAPGLTLEQLRTIDCARPEMEAISADLVCRCIATVRIGGALAVAASAGQARHNAAATLVGQRLPFAPPTGSVFAAWLPDKEVERWLGRVAEAERRQVSRTALELVRERGYSLGLINDAQREFSARLDAIASGRTHAAGLDNLIEDLAYDPAHLTPAVYSAVRLVSAPVFDASGQVALALTLYDFPKPPTSNGVESYVTRLINEAARVTEKLAGRMT
jgi:flavin reductase (DIM6/NTAB) family NADH-FMN oxidoreductase RutF/DNA-binding IclR family transcriptional regulator